MASDVSRLERLALFEAWNEKCVWCGRVLFLSQMEVEHLIPKTLPLEQRPAIFEMQGVAQDFDLHSLDNLAPSCGACNKRKSDRPPPEAPVIASLLRDAREKAPRVRDNARRFEERRRVERAVAIVTEAQRSDDESIRELLEAAELVKDEVTEVTGSVVLHLHPALKYLRGSERWTVAHERPNEVAYVVDIEAKRGGYTGTHHSWECSRCGSHGPWNGNICMTCGNREPPFDY